MSKVFLIVDDSTVARMVSRKIVQQIRPDWEILDVSSAKDAESVLSDQIIDIMLLDHSMPEMTGMEFAESIREAHPDLRLVMLTANIQSTMKDRAETLGMAFIEKPATTEKLTTAFDAIGI